MPMTQYEADKKFYDGELDFDGLIAGLESGEITVIPPPPAEVPDDWDEIARVSQPPPFSNIRRDLTPEQNEQLVEAIASARRRMGY